MNVLAVIADDNPAVTPTVPGFNGLKKLAVTHACVAPDDTDELVFPEIVILVPAIKVACLASNAVCNPLIVAI